MELLFTQVAAGLANGAIYACLALALVMIFVSTDHINFAQGELAMFSAFMCWQLLEWNVAFLNALPAVVAIAFVTGVAIERVVLGPLHNAPVLSIVVVFIGQLTIFHSMAGAIWDTSSRHFRPPSQGSRSRGRATSDRIRSACSWSRSPCSSPCSPSSA